MDDLTQSQEKVWEKIGASITKMLNETELMHIHENTDVCIRFAADHLLVEYTGIGSDGISHQSQRFIYDKGKKTFIPFSINEQSEDERVLLVTKLYKRYVGPADISKFIGIPANVVCKDLADSNCKQRILHS